LVPHFQQQAIAAATAPTAVAATATAALTGGDHPSRRCQPPSSPRNN